jgi:pimeloyl-ACP methyl ester carboxylesterase
MPAEREAMIVDQRGNIDFEERGQGPSILFVPGSCSTGAAWRSVVGELHTRFRCITTSLPGYGGSTERRTQTDLSIARMAEAVEIAVRAAAAPVHLVGHSFGGLVSLAVAIRGAVPLASLTMLEPPAVTILALDPKDAAHDEAFRTMQAAYRQAYGRGDLEAIGQMIDFYGGAGTFAGWPEKIRRYAVETTPVNLRDWQSAYGFALTRQLLAEIDCPVLAACGERSHRAMHAITRRLADNIPGGHHVTIDHAAHFMIATHADVVADLIESHVVDTRAWPRLWVA